MRNASFHGDEERGRNVDEATLVTSSRRPMNSISSIAVAHLGPQQLRRCCGYQSATRLLDDEGARSVSALCFDTQRKRHNVAMTEFGPNNPATKHIQPSLIADEPSIDLGRAQLPAIGAVAPWYGSARMIGAQVGKLLAGTNWVGVPFAGSMSELPHITARTIVVNDLHKGVITLARIIADEELGPKLYRRLRRHAFHPDDLANSQVFCRAMEKFTERRDTADTETILLWAESMFVSSWMARSGAAGTRSEFDAKLALRWTASGGDSAVRYQNAIRSINAWRRSLRRATFSTLDVFDFLNKCIDKPKHAIYSDQPFPGGPGDKYKHRFTPEQTEQLSRRLRGFQHARVVCRFYDHPTVPETLFRD